MTLKQVNNWDTDNPDKLGRQLSTFEDDVAAEANSIRAGFVPQLRVLRLRASATVSAFVVSFDQMTVIDTSLATGTAILPPLTAALFGRRAVLLFPSSAHSRFVTCQNPADNIQGSAGSFAANQGITEVFCDASGYWLK